MTSADLALLGAASIAAIGAIISALIGARLGVRLARLEGQVDVLQKLLLRNQAE